MKISGFTIVKNAVLLDYPIVESLKSILPIVDELVVLIGDGNDSTEELIRSIGSEKIKVFHSKWNPLLVHGGSVLADETNKAFQLINPNSTWAFYIQADEVLHEDGLELISKACEHFKDHKDVDVLILPYKNFYGTYDYIGDSRRWIAREGRIIKNDKTITAYRDAQGFRRRGKKLNGIFLQNAPIFHYSWVMDPKQIIIKNLHLSQYWSSDSALIDPNSIFNFNDDFDSLVRFTGSHPKVMKERINRKNWEIELDISKKRFSLKDWILFWIEKKFGKRLFEFKNYRIKGNF